METRKTQQKKQTTENTNVHIEHTKIDDEFNFQLPTGGFAQMDFEFKCHTPPPTLPHFSLHVALVVCEYWQNHIREVLCISVVNFD